MKQSNKIIIILPALILLISISISSNAQVAMNSSRHPLFLAGNNTFSDSGSNVSTLTNVKAETNFKHLYGSPVDAAWMDLKKDNALMCRFTLNKSIHRAFYSPRGKWLYTEFGYQGELLDKNIRNQVMSVYYNSSIVYVNEINQPAGKNVYVIELHDDTKITKLRVQGDEMEVIQQFLK